MVGINQSLGVIAWNGIPALNSWASEQTAFASVSPAGSVPFKFVFSGMAGLGPTAVGNAQAVADFCLAQSNPPTPCTFVYLASAREPDGSGPLTCSQVAAGAVDGVIAQMGQQFHRVEAIGIAPRFRLGWEFDGDWFPWASAPNPAAFKAAYIRFHDGLVAQCPTAKFDFHGDAFRMGGGFGVNTSTAAWDAAYPGSAYVDSVGPDIYSDFPASLSPNNADQKAKYAVELEKCRVWAVGKGKPISIGEWGLGDPQFYTGNGPGDQFNRAMVGTDMVQVMYNFLSDCVTKGPGLVYNTVFDSFPDASVGHRGFRLVSANDPNHAVGLAATTLYKQLFIPGNVIQNPPPTNLPREWIGIMPHGVGAGAPATPTNIGSGASNGSYTVTWTKPSDGGSAITSYTITPSDNGTPQAPITGVSAAVNSYAFAATNGHSWTATVIAVNAVGSSAASVSSPARTPGLSYDIVNAALGRTATGPSCTVTLSPAPISGNTIIVTCQDRSASTGPRTLTGTGITFTKRGSSPETAGIDCCTQIYSLVASGAAGESTAITYTVPGATNGLTIIAYEISGLGVFDRASTGQIVFGANGSAVPPTYGTSGTTATTTQADEFGICSFAVAQGLSTASFDQFAQLYNNSAFNDPNATTAFTGHQRFSATQTVTTNLSWLGSSNDCAGVVCTWKLV